MKNENEIMLENIASNLPIKDSMAGSRIATAERAKKKKPKIVRPVKPIFPDLYQVKVL